MALYKAAIAPHAHRENFLPALLFQPLTPRMLPPDDSPNALGIERTDGPIIGEKISHPSGRKDSSSPSQAHPLSLTAPPLLGCCPIASLLMDIPFRRRGHHLCCRRAGKAHRLSRGDEREIPPLHLPQLCSGRAGRLCRVRGGEPQTVEGGQREVRSRRRVAEVEGGLYPTTIKARLRP
jgi:hypothetical protein